MAYTNVDTVEWLRKLTKEYSYRHYEFNEESISKPLSKREFGVLKYIECHPNGATLRKIAKHTNIRPQSTVAGIVVKFVYNEKVFAKQRQKIMRAKKISIFEAPVHKIFARTSRVAKNIEFNAPVDLYKLL